MIHKGEIIEKAIRLSGIPISIIAKRLGKSRKHMYNLFENNQVPIETVLKIGKIINYDFSGDIKEILQIPDEYKIDVITEPSRNYEDASYWKSKYFELLEQHRYLLENKLKEFIAHDKPQKKS